VTIFHWLNNGLFRMERQNFDSVHWSVKGNCSNEAGGAWFVVHVYGASKCRLKV